MKKFPVIYLIIAFSIGLFTASSHAQNTLTIGIEQSDSKPYKWFENNIPIGPDIDILKELEKRSEIKFKYEYLPMEDLLKKLEEGTIDSALAIASTPEREKIATFLKTAPIHWTSMRFFLKKGTDFPLEKIEDLRGKMVGGIRGQSISKEFDAARKKNVFFLESRKDYKNMILMNNLGRTDCFVGITQAIQFHLSKMGLSEDITALHNPVLSDSPSYMAISKAAAIEDREDVIKDLEQAQESMIKEKLFEKISEEYGFTYKP